jgi:excisionase family DNA binding protein
MSARVQRYVPRRGLSRKEAAEYVGVSPSKFDELRKAGRIPPPKVLDGRLIFTVERLDEFLDALPDENQTDNNEWTASL